MLLRCVQELYIYFIFINYSSKTGVKDKKRFMSMHDVAESIGFEVSVILPILHAATGCDSTSVLHMGKAQHSKLLLIIWTILWRLDSYLAMIPRCYPLILFPHLSSICHTCTQGKNSTAVLVS